MADMLCTVRDSTLYPAPCTLHPVLCTLYLCLLCEYETGASNGVLQMKILEKAVYQGPSLYAHFPVIRLVVDLGPLEDWSTTRLGPAFYQPLLTALPGLREHGCSYGEPGGFVRRLKEDEGTWLGHVLEHVAIELQNAAGVQVTFGKTRGTGEPGQYDVVYEYEQAEVGLEAGTAGRFIAPLSFPKSFAPPWRVSRFRFQPGARRLHPFCPAAGAGSQHGVPGACG